MEKTKLALFGLGRAGQFHLQSIRALSQVRLKYLFDVDASRGPALAEEMNCQFTTDPHEIYADPEVEAVIVATPTQTHYGYVTSSLAAGKHVLAEKPLGVTLDEIDRCYELAAAAQRVLFIAFNRRFDPSFASLVQRVHQGEIGETQIIRTTSRDNPCPSLDYIKTSCGIFHDCIVHDLDMVCFIQPETPAEVFAWGSTFMAPIREVGDLDTVIVALRFPSGTLATIDISRKSVYGYDQRVEVFGSKGMLEARNRLSDTTVLATEAGLRQATVQFSFPTRYREAYLIELEQFVQCARLNRPAPLTHRQVRLSHLLADAAEESHRTGRAVAVRT